LAKGFNILLATAFGLPIFLAGPAAALFGPPDKSYNPSGNWDVGYQRNIGKNGICYAHANYSSGKTQIWIGSRLNEENNKLSWFFAIYNKDWSWIKPEKTYRLLLVPPEKKKLYWVDFQVVRHNDDGLSFLVSDITIELANALAWERRRNGVAIFSADKKLLTTLELTDSAGAIREVVQCRQDVLTTATAHEQPQTDPKKAAEGGMQFGTAFFVSPQYVLTNMHVIKGCKGEITVRYPDYRPERAYIAGTDETNDLALLKTEMRHRAIASFRFAPRLGEASYAYGFPLPGLLSTSGNFTLGNVTALSGINDDTRVLQTSTPVQPGNSGGPLLDDKAAVIGVVEKKLDALMVASKIGDVPQNINFAIQSPIAVNFLTIKGIAPSLNKAERKLDPADVAERAKEFTVQVICNG
jgi:serine protease Do